MHMYDTFNQMFHSYVAYHQLIMRSFSRYVWSGHSNPAKIPEQRTHPLAGPTLDSLNVQRQGTSPQDQLGQWPLISDPDGSR